jgi:hypothetical protein
MRRKRRSKRRNNRHEIGLGVIVLRRRDPGAAFLSLEAGKNPYLAGEQEAQGINRLPHPGSVGHHGNLFPLRQAIEADLQIRPAGARESAADLVVQPRPSLPI